VVCQAGVVQRFIVTVGEVQSGTDRSTYGDAGCEQAGKGKERKGRGLGAGAGMVY
jgi:hypothetical protein